jgi:CHASE3 domain sensor protein
MLGDLKHPITFIGNIPWRNAISILFPAIFVLIAVAGYYNDLRYAQAEKWLMHTHEVIETLQQTFSTLQDAETGERGYLLSGKVEYLQPYHEAVNKTRRYIGKLFELTKDNSSQQKRLTDLQSIIEKRFDELQKTISLRNEKGIESAIQIIIAGKGKLLMDSIREVMGQMQVEEEALLQQRQKNLKLEIFRRHIAMLVGGIVALFLLALRVFLSLKSKIHKWSEEVNR